MSPEARNGSSGVGDDLDPVLRTFISRMSAAWNRFPPLSAVAPAEARRIADEVRRPWSRGGPEIGTVAEHMVPAGEHPVRVRLYDPSPGRRKPALIFMHGGGWTIFSLETHDRLMREYAHRAGVAVAGVGYAQSPEAKFPVALEQVVAVARFLADRGAELGVDPARIVVGGDSAGANLAAGACLRLRDEGRGDLVAGMLLIYGVFNRHMSERARRFGGPGYMLSTEDMEWFWHNYLGDDVDGSEPLISPVNAELEGLPPAFLVAGACDLLAEQSREMHERLRSAGVEAELRMYAGACHSFLEAVSISQLARDAVDESAAWVRKITAVP